MAAIVKEKSTKIVLDLKEGTQTISPVSNDVTDDNAYETGDAIATLVASPCEAIKLVVTETVVTGA